MVPTGLIVFLGIMVVLIVLTARGKLGPEARVPEQGDLSAKEKRRRGEAQRAYLYDASKIHDVTYEVVYASGETGFETVSLQSERYRKLKELEPKRLSMKGGWGDKVEIIYEDGHATTCNCSIINLEAGDTRRMMLSMPDENGK